MGAEEINGFRLNRMETDIKETKDDISKVKDLVTIIDKNQIRADVVNAEILRTNITIRNAFVVFVVLNILGVVVAFFVKFGI